MQQAQTALVTSRDCVGGVPRTHPSHSIGVFKSNQISLASPTLQSTSLSLQGYLSTIFS
jgi:hypothetical protein